MAIDSFLKAVIMFIMQKVSVDSIIKNLVDLLKV